MAYSVEFCGSSKEEGNDDHITATEPATVEDAWRDLSEMKEKVWLKGRWSHAYVEGPEGRVHEGVNQDYVPEADEPDAEAAMQQGMAHGSEAYNEAICSPSGGPEHGI